MKAPINSTESVIYVHISTLGIVSIVTALLLALFEIFVFQNADKLPGQIVCFVAGALLIFGIWTLYEEFFTEETSRTK